MLGKIRNDDLPELAVRLRAVADHARDCGLQLVKQALERRTSALRVLGEFKGHESAAPAHPLGGASD
jgi:hypothetical protein